MEAEVAKSYVDKGAVTSQYVEVTDAGRVHYLQAGPKSGRVVIFCHGAAFSARTWQITGVLDLLAEHGYHAIAVDFPGYGAQKSGAAALHGEHARRFIHNLVDALGIGHNGARIALVSASMGGSYAVPFLMERNDDVAGYVTVAGNSDGLAQHVPLEHVPALIIYGDKDARFHSSQPQLYQTSFPRSQRVVLKDAPHPAYLRDAEAARYFSSLVLEFLEGTGPEKLSVSAQWTTTSAPARPP